MVSLALIELIFLEVQNDCDILNKKMPNLDKTLVQILRSNTAEFMKIFIIIAVSLIIKCRIRI